MINFDFTNSPMASEKDLIVGKIKVATKLSHLKVWQFAKIVELLQEPADSDAEKIYTITNCLECASDQTAIQWMKYKTDFALEQFEKVKAIIELGLPDSSESSFIFTTLTPEDNEKRLAEIKAASFLHKISLRENLEIDQNRTFVVNKVELQSFEQIIKAETIQKELITLDAEVAVRNFSKLPRLLAFICQFQGESLHYLDQNDKQYKFNYALCDYREKVFRHLNMDTAWKAYNGFFLTETQR